MRQSSSSIAPASLRPGARCFWAPAVCLALVLPTWVSAQEGAASQPARSDPAIGAASQPAGASSQPAAAASQPASPPVDDTPPKPVPTSAKAPAKKESVAQPQSAPSPAVWRTDVTAAGVTNRPGASETSSVLPQGAILLQTGLDLSSSGALSGNQFSETRSATLPDFTARIGVLDFLEVRAGAKYVIETQMQDGASTAELTGYRVGTHIGLLEESMWLPAAALSLGLDIPLPSFAYDAIGGEARLAWSKGLFDVMGVGGNFAGGWDGASKAPFLAYTLNATGSLSDTVTPFIEVFGDYLMVPGSLPTVWVDGGVQWALTDWLALDAAIGINVYGAGLSYFTSVGASFLIPGHLMIFGGRK